jgi:hypothetical protein|tara:strand:+ start:445 stop:696 length:252 start_codon:yes stop_codon:yes gene_type:complete
VLAEYNPNTDAPNAMTPLIAAATGVWGPGTNANDPVIVAPAANTLETTPASPDDKPAAETHSTSVLVNSRILDFLSLVDLLAF